MRRWKLEDAKNRFSELVIPNTVVSCLERRYGIRHSGFRVVLCWNDV